MGLSFGKWKIDVDENFILKTQSADENAWATFRDQSPLFRLSTGYPWKYNAILRQQRNKGEFHMEQNPNILIRMT